MPSSEWGYQIDVLGDIQTRPISQVMAGLEQLNLQPRLRALRVFGKEQAREAKAVIVYGMSVRTRDAVASYQCPAYVIMPTSDLLAMQGQPNPGYSETFALFGADEGNTFVSENLTEDDIRSGKAFLFLAPLNRVGAQTPEPQSEANATEPDTPPWESFKPDETNSGPPSPDPNNVHEEEPTESDTESEPEMLPVIPDANALGKMTIRDLRSLANKFGIPQYGTKQNIVDRLKRRRVMEKGVDNAR